MICITGFTNLSSSSLPELPVALMLGRLEQGGDGGRLVPPGFEAGAVGPGVGGVPRGAAHLAHQLP